LGVAQDAGYPQAGCYQPHCMPGWENKTLQRGATSIALIDPVAKTKILFEATPNLPQQLYNLEQEAPSTQYTFEGVFLTHAHIGHYAGLMFFGHEAMGSNNIPVYAMPKMAEYLAKNGPWSQLVDYGNISLRGLQHNQALDVNGITITPFLVPHRDEFSETVGYLIEGPSKTAVFIPDINKWSVWDTDIAELITQVDYALLDATFFDDGELPGRDMSKVPHPLVTETMQRLGALSVEQRNKVWFIHMNHTNPLLDADSQASKRVRAAGFNITSEGIRLEL
ncbi:MAG: MBL fold metallo-hydrolase, partial [Porticoccaceae bacterium]|nr:MBL fold metallo-hydrolase [Porticoccaceae bacterium]